MNDAEKKVLKYLSTHAPATLRKIKDNTNLGYLELFHILCVLYKQGKIEHIDFNIKGNWDPDYQRKYTIKK